MYISAHNMKIRLAPLKLRQPTGQRLCNVRTQQFFFQWDQEDGEFDFFYIIYSNLEGQNNFCNKFFKF